MRKKVKKIGIQTLGLVCLVIGVAGLVLPFLNGIFFLAVGLLLLSVYSPGAKKLLHKIGRQHPKAEAAVLKMEGWLMTRIGEID
jgi:uncharacterized protein